MSHHDGRFIWHEAMAKDVSRSKAFYASLFGWTYEDTNTGAHGAYTMVKNGDKAIAGMMAPPPGAEGMPTHWVSYVSVPDVDASIAAAKKHGGQSHWGPHDLPNVGRIAGITAFDGASIAVIHPAGPDQPIERPVSGGFCWETLTTADIERSRTFWPAVVGWKPSSGMGAPTFAVGEGMENQVADMQKVPPNVRPHWLTFVLVDSLDASCTTVGKLGGKIIVPDAPVGDMGRFAVITDDQGAAIGLYQATK